MIFPAGTLGRSFKLFDFFFVNCFDWFHVSFYSPIQGGVDAKELFHLYIMIWIQDRRLSLLESCKLDKVYIYGFSVCYLLFWRCKSIFAKINMLQKLRLDTNI